MAMQNVTASSIDACLGPTSVKHILSFFSSLFVVFER